MKTLDREQLGLRKFWKEFEVARKANENVQILTHRNNVESLQKDLKLLLKRANAGHAVVGLTPGEIAVISEVLQWVFLMTLFIFAIYPPPRHETTLKVSETI